MVYDGKDIDRLLGGRLSELEEQIHQIESAPHAERSRRALELSELRTRERNVKWAQRHQRLPRKGPLRLWDGINARATVSVEFKKTTQAGLNGDQAAASRVWGEPHTAMIASGQGRRSLGLLRRFAQGQLKNILRS